MRLHLSNIVKSTVRKGSRLAISWLYTTSYKYDKNVEQRVLAGAGVRSVGVDARIHKRVDHAVASSIIDYRTI